MSHQVDKMMYSDYAMPWHGLGTAIEGLATSAEALKKAGLNFQVKKAPIFRKTKKGKYVEVPNHFETFRTDRDLNLGVVGRIYTPYQNETAFDFMDGLVGGKEAMFDTAGSLRNGATVWMLAKLPGHIKVKSDAVEKFLLLSNGHDGTMPITVKFTPVRVVCCNTLTAALREGKSTVQSQLRIRHTINAHEKMIEASRILGISNEYFEKTSEIYGEMAGFKINKALLDKYFTTIIPDPPERFGNDGAQIVNNTKAVNTREKLVEIFETSPTINKVKSAKGTLWGAFNSVTEYIQHYKLVPNEDKVDGLRFDVTVANQFSGSHLMRQDAMNAALELVKK